MDYQLVNLHLAIEIGYVSLIYQIKIVSLPLLYSYVTLLEGTT